ETVHLDQKLVERLLALIVATAETSTTGTAHGVDFVDEDDARRVFLGLLEHVADAAGADADEHFDEVRTGDGEERPVCLAGNRSRHQGFAGARRTNKQHAARHLAAEALKLAWIAKELHDLSEVRLGFVTAGNVLERDATVCLGEQLGATLA